MSKKLNELAKSQSTAKRQQQAWTILKTRRFGNVGRYYSERIPLTEERPISGDQLRVVFLDGEL